MPKYQVREYEHITVERVYFVDAETEELAREVSEGLAEKPAPKHTTVHECDFDITKVTPKFLVRGWVNFAVEAEDEIEAAEKINQAGLKHPYLDGWGLDEVQEWNWD